MTEEDKALLDEAARVRGFAYAPYSNFKVGAAIRTKDGKMYGGCNIENSSFSSTMCAERTALFRAVSSGETDFDAATFAARKQSSVLQLDESRIAATVEDGHRGTRIPEDSAAAVSLNGRCINVYVKAREQ